MVSYDTHKPSKPMFKNQNPAGFWGDCDAFGHPPIETIPATIASMLAVKQYKTGALTIQKVINILVHKMHHTSKLVNLFTGTSYRRM